MYLRLTDHDKVRTAELEGEVRRVRDKFTQ